MTFSSVGMMGRELMWNAERGMWSQGSQFREILLPMAFPGLLSSEGWSSLAIPNSGDGFVLTPQHSGTIKKVERILYTLKIELDKNHGFFFVFVFVFLRTNDISRPSEDTSFLCSYFQMKGLSWVCVTHPCVRLIQVSRFFLALRCLRQHSCSHVRKVLRTVHPASSGSKFLTVRS